MTTIKNIFQEHELDAFLGEPEDFDVEAIIDEATEIDYKTGNRVWVVDTDELNEIAARNRKAEPKKVAMVTSDNSGLVLYDLESGKYFEIYGDGTEELTDEYRFATRIADNLDYENEEDWLEAARYQSGMNILPGMVRDEHGEYYLIGEGKPELDIIGEVIWYDGYDGQGDEISWGGWDGGAVRDLVESRDGEYDVDAIIREATFPIFSDGRTCKVFWRQGIDINEIIESNKQ